MEINFFQPFVITQPARKPKPKKILYEKIPFKKIKHESDQNNVKFQNSTEKFFFVPIEESFLNDQSPKNSEKNALNSETVNKTINSLCFFMLENDYWSKMNKLNERKLVFSNQSIDTQSSLSYSPCSEDIFKKMKEFYQEGYQFSKYILEKTEDNLNERISLMDSDEKLYSNIFFNIEEKEIKRFPVPFDKEIINYIDDDDF